MALGDRLEEEIGRLPFDWQIAHVVDDQSAADSRLESITSEIERSSGLLRLSHIRSCETASVPIVVPTTRSGAIDHPQRGIIVGVVGGLAPVLTSRKHTGRNEPGAGRSAAFSLAGTVAGLAAPELDNAGSFRHVLSFPRLLGLSA